MCLFINVEAIKVPCVQYRQLFETTLYILFASSIKLSTLLMMQTK
jgi:hypothetical protein